PSPIPPSPAHLSAVSTSKAMPSRPSRLHWRNAALTAFTSFGSSERLVHDEPLPILSTIKSITFLYGYLCVHCPLCISGSINAHSTSETWYCPSSLAEINRPSTDA